MFSFFKSKPKRTSHLPQHVSPSYSPQSHPDPESGYNDVTFVSSPAPFILPTPTSASFDSSYPPRASSHPPPTRGYPSLTSTFTRLESLLADTAPSLLDSLAPPLPASSPALISLLHTLTPYYLPTPVLESYLLHDGQEPFSTAPGLVYGLRWMPLDEVEQEWRFWRRLEDAGGEGGMEDAFGTKAREGGARGEGRTHPGLGEARDGGVAMDGMSAFPPGWVRSKYSHPGWLPLLSDRAGNYVGVDLDPPPPGAGAEGEGYGQPGQVIAFGREIDEKVVLFPGDSAGGWGRFLAAFVEDVERGEFASLGELGRMSGREWDEEGGGRVKEGSDEEWGEGDGIGDRSYFEGDRYGEEGGDEDRSESQLWTLRAEYRRWLAGPGECGLIGALAERSRRKWRSVGIGAAPPSQSQRQRTPLTILVPEDPSSGPESSATERPSSPAPLLESTPAASPALGPLDNSVELVLSPPSPKSAARLDSIPAPARSPELLEARSRPAGLGKKGRGRPPPPPMALDLPTMFDLDAPNESNVRDDHLSGPYGGNEEPRASFGSGGTPPRDMLLGSGEGGSKGASSTALVQGDEGAGLSLEGLGINAGSEEGYGAGGR